MNFKPLLIFLLFISSCFFYSQIKGLEENPVQIFNVTRIIDGDTLEVSNNQKIRLLGINTPEKGNLYSKEAENFLSNKTLNKEVKIRIKGVDKYNRILAHIFLEDLHLNKEILRKGLASLYYYEKDEYHEELALAEEFARLNKIGVWKESENKGCLEIKDFIYKEKTARCSNEELLTIENNCNYNLNIIIKDDATHIYSEEIKANSILSKNFSCIWNDEGDTIYISDSEGLLIFYRYK